MSFLLAQVNSSSQETHELMPLLHNVISFGPNISTPEAQSIALQQKSVAASGTSLPPTLT